jgi:hypothetical protein
MHSERERGGGANSELVMKTTSPPRDVTLGRCSHKTKHSAVEDYFIYISIYSSSVDIISNSSGGVSVVDNGACAAVTIHTIHFKKIRSPYHLSLEQLKRSLV